MRDESYLGRGFEPIAGRPFGWAWHEERAEIRSHLRRRIWRFGFDNLVAARLEKRVDEIQRRLHREKPTMRERQAAWLARQPVATPREPFTREELERIADHFAGANDPVAASIFAKASQ